MGSITVVPQAMGLMLSSSAGQLFPGGKPHLNMEGRRFEKGNAVLFSFTRTHLVLQCYIMLHVIMKTPGRAKPTYFMAWKQEREKGRGRNPIITFKEMPSLT